MELVRVQAGRRNFMTHRGTSLDAFRERLLGDDSQFLPSDARNWSERRRARGLFDGRASVPPISLQTYRPPQLDERGTIAAFNEESPVASELFFNGPASPSISRAIRQQTPARTTSSMNWATGDSGGPAEDLGGSYGFLCVQCVRTQEIGFMEDMGRFQEILEPGMYVFCWPFSDIAGRLSLRVQQLDVVCETKTKDNVFVHVQVTVQFRVILQKAFDAYYRLTNPSIQIQSYVFDVIRSTIPRMSLDQTFESKSMIASSLKLRLVGCMHEFGYEIVDALVTDVSPDPHVRASMNEMNASKRLKEAMPHRAEAEKIRIVKAAEAAAEAAYLSGVGIANERRAIAEGMKASILEVESLVDPKEVMDVLLLTQYFDTLTAIGCDDLFMCHTMDEVMNVETRFASSRSPPAGGFKYGSSTAIRDLLW